MTLTDRVVHETLGIVAELAYFSIVHKGELRLLFLRPYGARGQGIWVRRVLPGPKISPAWGGPS